MYQHVLSRVLLKRFTDHTNGPVSSLDLDTLVTETLPISELGGIDDLVRIGGESLERLWNREVETPLPHAFELLDAGRLLDSESGIERIKKCIALHWARSFTLKAMIDQRVPVKADEIANRLLARFTPEQVLQALTGFTIVGPSAVSIARDRIEEAFQQDLENKGFKADQFRDHFQTAQQKVATFSLEIWHAPGGDFVIGDVPVVNWDKNTDRIGPLQGVSWDRSDAVFMPLGPNHVVALSKEHRVHQADASTVERLNVLQVRGAFREIYFRPGSGLGDVIAKALRAGSGA